MPQSEWGNGQNEAKGLPVLPCAFCCHWELSVWILFGRDCLGRSIRLVRGQVLVRRLFDQKWDCSCFFHRRCVPLECYDLFARDQTLIGIIRCLLWGFRSRLYGPAGSSWNTGPWSGALYCWRCPPNCIRSYCHAIRRKNHSWAWNRYTCRSRPNIPSGDIPREHSWHFDLVPADHVGYRKSCRELDRVWMLHPMVFDG